jgi:cell division septation protein DedD
MASERPPSTDPDDGRGARRRSRYEQERGDGSGRRLLMLVAAIGLIAVVWLFWRPGRPPAPTGIGDQLMVVTAADSTGRETARPRSGSVDIDRHETRLVPEAPTGSAQASTVAPANRTANAGAGSAEPPAQKPPARRPAEGGEAPRAVETPTASGHDAGDVPVPGPSGEWAVQLGAFGSEENASSLANRLRSRGYEPRLRTDSGAGSAVFYRVWIGYFATREAAARFARAHAADLGESFPVHR